jgi:kynurenine formamidase
MMRRLCSVVLLACGLSVALVGQTPPPRAPRNAAEFDELFERVSNWGRWGKDDQLGSANLVTPAKRKQAIALAKDAVSVSLAHNPLTERAEDNASPFEHSMNPTVSRPLQLSLVDTYKVSYHGYAHSHIDALCHILYKDRTYNGYARVDVETERGCAKLSIDNLKNGIITRGILLDIPRLMNLPYLDPGAAVYTEDLEAWERKAGVRIAAGDAIFLRTGRWARREKLGPWNVAQNAAGIHASVAPWIKARGIAFIGSDVALDVLPSRVEGVTLPMHILMITALGINLLDNQDLEALADTAAKLNRWEFMLTVAPVPVTGGTGFPVNAIATF